MHAPVLYCSACKTTSQANIYVSRLKFKILDFHVNVNVLSQEAICQIEISFLDDAMRGICSTSRQRVRKGPTSLLYYISKLFYSCLSIIRS